MDTLLYGSVVLTVLLAGTRRLDRGALLLGLQALTLGGLTFWLAAVEQQPELYLAGTLTIAVKGLAVPGVILFVLRRLSRKVDPHPILAPELAMAAAAGMMLLARAVIPAELFGPARIDGYMAAGTGALLAGLLIMVTRRQVVAQLEGLIVMENGIYLAALGATRGMPFVVELGVLLDLLVAVLILGLLTFRIGTTLDSLNTDRLSELKG